MTHTVRFQRVLRAPAERIYRAFLDPAAMCKWLPPHGFTGTVQQMDAVVGGQYRMSCTHFGSGHTHSFGGEYLQLEPAQKLVYTARFDDPNLPGQMQTTVLLRSVFCGTELQIEQQGIPEMIPAEACIMGWQESLQLLQQLVEPEIPG